MRCLSCPKQRGSLSSKRKDAPAVHLWGLTPVCVQQDYRVLMSDAKIELY